MRRAYQMGAKCFYLPSMEHLESFREIRNLVEDESLIGIAYLNAEQGLSFHGSPLHRYENRVISTLKKNLFPPGLIQRLKSKGIWTADLFFPDPVDFQVFTQREIDRISFDSSRFETALSAFSSEESPFLLLGGRYTDWITGLGRVDLLGHMVSSARQNGFVPILSARWTTYVLPKTKALDAAAYAIPINRKWALFDLPHACDIIKKFEKPLMGLNPFTHGKSLRGRKEDLLFLLSELKLSAVIVELDSEDEVRSIIKAAEGIPSLILPRKT